MMCHAHRGMFSRHPRSVAVMLPSGLQGLRALNRGLLPAVWACRLPVIHRYRHPQQWVSFFMLEPLAQCQTRASSGIRARRCA
ncbi:hypothetical protein Dda3937_01715 [Dickeya dadantii 3937]|uniref:Uncharacterized protein n=1 Tax=Dickeya dadantii (strain 3937) TaxID=198628 RepID=E0SMS3_DICD3|nr:hypothetical protein Dda3937_01715 [Dickeya dadantii 3937]